MDALSDPTVHTIVIMSSAQVGKTEIINNIVGYYIDQDPAPMLLVQPTVEMAKAWSKDRLAPMIRDTPALHDKVKDPTSRDAGNTVLHKTFPGGHITMAGANSPAGLAMRPVRIVLLDEVNRYPPSAGSEGDPANLALKRSTTFWNRKHVMSSTPTVSGARIEVAYENSDQRRLHVPCPDCGHEQTFKWAQVTWANDDPSTAAYVCEECGSAWSDAKRWAAVRWGKWVASAPFNGVAGFHINEMASPWVRLAQMVQSFLEAKDDPGLLQTWVNTSLGETWVEQGDAPDWQKLYDRLEDWRELPEGALFITAGVDVQTDRIEATMWAWGVGKESWEAEHKVMMGDPHRPEVWQELDALLSQVWRTQDGRELPILRLAIDSGYATTEVYNWARAKPPARVMVVKGAENGPAIAGQPRAVDVTIGGKRIARGMKSWPVGTSVTKSETYGWLKLDQPTRESGDPYPPGYVHLSRHWCDEEGCKQLVAEQLVTKLVKGYQRRQWQKIRDRNERLDCRVYARAAAASLGLDRGYAERLAAQLAKAKANDDETDGEPAIAAAVDGVSAPKPPERAKRRRPRRQSSWVGSF